MDFLSTHVDPGKIVDLVQNLEVKFTDIDKEFSLQVRNWFVVNSNTSRELILTQSGY